MATCKENTESRESEGRWQLTAGRMGFLNSRIADGGGARSGEGVAAAMGAGLGTVGHRCHVRGRGSSGGC